MLFERRVCDLDEIFLVGFFPSNITFLLIIRNAHFSLCVHIYLFTFQGFNIT